MDELDTDATEAARVGLDTWGWKWVVIFALDKFYRMKIKVNTIWSIPAGATKYLTHRG